LIFLKGTRPTFAENGSHQRWNALGELQPRADPFPSIRDGRLGTVEVTKAIRQFRDRDEPGPWKMPALVLPRLSHVDQIVGFGAPLLKEGANLLGGPGGNGFEIVE